MKCGLCDCRAEFLTSFNLNNLHQSLKSHMWLEATVLDTKSLGHKYMICIPIQIQYSIWMSSQQLRYEKAKIYLASVNDAGKHEIHFKNRPAYDIFLILKAINNPF